MSVVLTNGQDKAAAKIERVLIGGDLSQLNAEERVQYYRMVCESVGLNPLTKPFEYIKLNGKDTLYATKNASEQLRKIHNIGIKIVAREIMDDCYVVTAQATMANGRTDESVGAVSIGGLKGEAKCNAIMKCETKAKRRVTLSVCSLGMLDETEVETIPQRHLKPVAVTTEDTVLEAPTVVSPEGAVSPKAAPVFSDEPPVDDSPDPPEPPDLNESGDANYAPIGRMLGSINLDGLKDHERTFIEDTKGRYDRYGEGMKISPKQLAWLKRLAAGE